MTQQPGETAMGFTLTLTFSDLRPETIREGLAAFAALLPPIAAPDVPVEVVPEPVIPQRAPLQAHPDHPADRSKVGLFLERHGNEGVDVVRDYFAPGSEVDTKRIKTHLNMGARSNLLAPVLRALGCTDPTHSKWIAPQ